VRYGEIALRPDQADYAAHFLQRSATYLLAVAVKDAILAVVSDAKASGDSEVRAAYQIACLLNKARDEYPLSRSVVALLAGVLEAVFAGRIPDLRAPTLGKLLSKAHEIGVLQPGSRVSALSSLVLHLWNYIHADLGSRRTEYLIDISTAKGCKVALDWALAEMVEWNRGAIST